VPRHPNETAEAALRTIRSLARVYIDERGNMPAELDKRYAWAIKTIFETANDALVGGGARVV